MRYIIEKLNGFKALLPALFYLNLTPWNKVNYTVSIRIIIKNSELRGVVIARDNLLNYFGGFLNYFFLSL